MCDMHLDRAVDHIERVVSRHEPRPATGAAPAPAPTASAKGSLSEAGAARPQRLAPAGRQPSVSADISLRLSFRAMLAP